MSRVLSEPVAEEVSQAAEEVAAIARALVIRLIEEERARHPQPEPLEKLLSAEEVAELFDRDKDFVYRLKREGHLKAVQITEKTFLFNPAEVRRFIAQGGVHGLHGVPERD